MAGKTITKGEAKQTTRKYPSIEKDADGKLTAVCDDARTLTTLYATQTDDAARGIFMSAINALGTAGEIYRPLVVAINAELEPRDAVEAMLVTQMTATHVAMTALSQKMMDATMYDVRESLERSMTRLSRTYLAQVDALKKYRAKAQQVVRVERVTVQDGGQAIVGNVDHAGGR